MCELLDGDICKATELYCFRNHKPDRWCKTYVKAYTLGYVDCVNKWINRVREIRNDITESVCKDTKEN